MGYELIESKNVIYPKQPGWRYQNRKCNNTFIFADSESKITLYYEPIVYDEDMREINNIGVYRNNDISFNADGEDERTGHYYVPDYIIKYSRDNRDIYSICDAKFTKTERVLHKHVPALAYKYLTSISPIDSQSEVKGMYILYGITMGKNSAQSFYNKMIGFDSITPRIGILPISEDVSYSCQDNNLKKIFEL